MTLGSFVSIFNAVVRDIASILTIIMSPGMFAVPVIYPPPATWPMSLRVNYVNPVSGFVTAARDMITLGYMTYFASYIASTVLSILIFFVGWRAFHLVEPKIAERI